MHTVEMLPHTTDLGHDGIMLSQICCCSQPRKAVQELPRRCNRYVSGIGKLYHSRLVLDARTCLVLTIGDRDPHPYRWGG